MTRRPTHPGAVLRQDILTEMGLTPTQFAALLGVTRPALDAVLSERRSITKGLAQRLARVLGTTPELWLNLQRAVDDWQANAMASSTVSQRRRFGSFISASIDTYGAISKRAHRTRARRAYLEILADSLPTAKVL